VLSGSVVRYVREVLRAADYFEMRRWQEAVEGPRFEVGRGRIRHVEAELERPTRRVPLAVFQTLVPIAFSLLDANNAAVRWFGAALVVGYGLPALAALAMTVAAIPFGVVLALGLLPCGWTLPLAGPYLELAAEPVPPGTWSVTQFTTEGGEGALSHGKAHDDHDVFYFIGKWLASRATEAGSPTPLS
jgi:hypothetical protein